MCDIDFPTRTIKIYNVFKDSTESYTAEVQITLERIRNPFSNFDLVPFLIKTFDDKKEEIPIDELSYTPLTQCDWPCKRCSADKSYCFKCWEDSLDFALPFLNTVNQATSTCSDKCFDGFTTDGKGDKVCERCGVSCATCQDIGSVGDKNECLECADGYNFRLGQKCVERCPLGTYTAGSRCLPCDSTCLSCKDSADFCTACDGASAFNFLFENKCRDTCP